MKKLFLVIILALFCIMLLSLYGKKTKDDRVIIKFSSWGSQSEIALLKPLLNQFEKENSDIKIKFVHIPQNYFQKIHLLYASKLEPDVVFLNNYYAIKYIKAGLLEDLTPYFETKPFFEKSLVGFTYEKRLYAIPRDVSNLVVFYNKDIFDKYNIPYPSAEWTISDYIKTAQKLTKDSNKDGKTDLWGTSFETEPIYLLPFLFSNGASVLNDDGTKLTIDSDEFRDALDLYASVVNKYKAAPAKAESASLTMAQMFLGQKIAMHLSGRWLVPKYREEADFDWDIVNFPNGNAGSVVNIDSSGYAVSKSSEHKSEAIKFVKFISSEKSMETLSKSGLIVPARKDAAYSTSFLSPQEKPFHSKVFLDSIENGKPTPVSENYQKITDRLNTALEPVYLGIKSARDVVNPELLKDICR